MEIRSPLASRRAYARAIHADAAPRPDAWERSRQMPWSWFLRLLPSPSVLIRESFPPPTRCPPSVATESPTNAAPWLHRSTPARNAARWCCLLYTSDAADEEDSVDLGGRRIIKKK